jgi:hypothetical protein
MNEPAVRILPTHEVTNQPPPLPSINLYEADTALVDAVRRSGAEAAEPHLKKSGKLAGDESAQELARLAHRYRPELRAFDRFSHRKDAVEFHPAYHGMPEVRLGIPSVAEAALLPMLVGWGRARQMLLLGENFDARQALEWKFVEQVAPREQLDEAVQVLVRQALSCAPAAVRLQKSLIRSWEDLPLRAAIAAGIDAFARAYNTDEPQSRMRDFLEMQAKRKAQS